MTITGRVNPNSLMVVLEKYGKHGDLKYVKFDGEIKEIRPYNNYNYFGQHEFPSYGRLNPTFPPPFAYPLNQMNEANLRVFPRPMAPPPRPPPPVGPFRMAPPFPPPLVPPFWAVKRPKPRPPRSFPKGSEDVKKEKPEKDHKHCTLM